MHYPDIDKYAGMDSPVHRIEPRIKIISFGILIVSAVFVGTIPASLFFLAVAVVILLASRLPMRFILTRMKVICVFVIPILVLMPLTVPGTPLFSAGPVSISQEGVSFAVLVTVRSVTAILLVVTMLGTQRFDTTLKALSLLRVPGIIIQMLLFTYRYIYVMIDEFLRIWSSMRAKGYTFRFNRHGLTIIGNLIGMLLINSYERAERVYQAMIAKGYTGNPISFSPFRVTIPDCLFCAAVITLAVGVHINYLEIL
ncbi:cobalt ECF transporter T component CbiQ [Methanogenium sp. MK-MG]|uniref:cobalt ECF transporter T component CbiQ n=1 Tax=Methanogenium sp. MK-MG TaxID=2599926 RepID=UPI001C202708|nr:cobalt ECF transporter T component CbiQ [Methanogenium sp. MK-MG]KAF1076392.1 Energy-coupling factor transporter transmembrane protein EcfT [Methanogenium sp. MK-MG]